MVSPRWLKSFRWWGGAFLLVGLLVGLWLWYRPELRHAGGATTDADIPVALVPDRAQTLRLSPDTVQAMGLESTLAVAPPPTHPLRLNGSLSIDPSRLAHIHVRFPGEVVEVGRHKPKPAESESGGDEQRPLRVGDAVEKGHLLAVVWSREIGDKKSDLIDSLSQYYLDRRILDRLRALPLGAIPQRTIDEAERSLEADMIAVARSERTLRSWNLSEQELNEIRAEAEHIHRTEGSSDSETARRWAEVDVRSPLAGIVLEKNVVPGDIVDTQLDLFKVADLSRLRVVANVYEDDLPKLEQLSDTQRRWSIRLKSHPDAPEIEGVFDLVGFLVEPSQHTAVITGWLDNPQGHFRVGQFITATIELSNAAGLVAVPDTAVVDEGTQSHVFIASDAGISQITRRAVAVRRRSQGVVYLASEPNEAERQAGCQPLALGERVLTTGTVELSGALATLAIEEGPAPPASRRE